MEEQSADDIIKSILDEEWEWLNSIKQNISQPKDTVRIEQ